MPSKCRLWFESGIIQPVCCGHEWFTVSGCSDFRLQQSIVCPTTSLKFQVEGMSRVAEDLICFLQNQLIVQLGCRHLVNSDDLASCLDHTLQFAVILGPHISKSANQAKRENTLQDRFTEQLENVTLYSKLPQFPKKEHLLLQFLRLVQCAFAKNQFINFNSKIFKSWDPLSWYTINFGDGDCHTSFPCVDLKKVPLNEMYFPFESIQWCIIRPQVLCHQHI